MATVSVKNTPRMHHDGIAVVTHLRKKLQTTQSTQRARNTHRKNSQPPITPEHIIYHHVASPAVQCQKDPLSPYLVQDAMDEVEVCVAPNHQSRHDYHHRHHTWCCRRTVLPPITRACKHACAMNLVGRLSLCLLSLLCVSPSLCLCVGRSV